MFVFLCVMIISVSIYGCENLPSCLISHVKCYLQRPWTPTNKDQSNEWGKEALIFSVFFQKKEKMNEQRMERMKEKMTVEMNQRQHGKKIACRRQQQQMTKKKLIRVGKLL